MSEEMGSPLVSLDHEALVVRRGVRGGVYIIVAVHSTVLGPALGGCRMTSYASAAEAVRDALRLARGMTYKSAAAGLPLGGGKSVIAMEPGVNRESMPWPRSTSGQQAHRAVALVSERAPALVGVGSRVGRAAAARRPVDGWLHL